VQSADVPRLERSRDDLLFHLKFLLGFFPGTTVELNLRPRPAERVWESLDRKWVVEMIIPIILLALDQYRVM
jgi:hypothetical protein